MTGTMCCCSCVKSPLGHATASITSRSMARTRSIATSLSLQPPRVAIAASTSQWTPRNPLSNARAFSSSPCHRANPVDTPVDLTFPTTRSPSPFDIFHFSPSQSRSLTRADIKGRYLDLVKIYHPDRAVASGDKGKGKGKQHVEDKFVRIQAAYELLADPKRRELYIRTGLGWGSTSNYAGGAGGAGSGSPWSQSTTEYHFRRGRPMSSSTRAGAYAYDWASSGYTWTDPYNPHFRPGQEGGGMSANGAAAGWKGEGSFGKNGFIFLALASVTMLVTPLTAWYAVPTGPGEPPLGLGTTGQGGPGGAGEAWMPRVYDKKHNDAARNLQLAREEARTRGHEKREAIKRRVEEIRRIQAFERAMEVQAIERGQGGTGHLALPPPSSPM